jgi:Pyridoxamine 5'-phosphate oxidase
VTEFDEKIRKALAGKNFWSLATVNPDGSPRNRLSGPMAGTAGS